MKERLVPEPSNEFIESKLAVEYQPFFELVGFIDIEDLKLKL